MGGAGRNQQLLAFKGSPALSSAVRPYPWIAAVLAAAVPLLFSGCGRSSRVDLGSRHQILHLGNGAEPKDLDPCTQSAEIEYIIGTALFEGLVNIANDGDTILPGVAERWDISPDGRTYTFHLRANARWSDGIPLTASDFEYSFRRVFIPAMASPQAYLGYAIAGARDMVDGKQATLGVRAVDPRTLEVRLDYPAPYILYILAGPPFDPVPRSLVERFGGGDKPFTAWSLPGNLVSNGAFTLKAWPPGEAVVVAKNPNYWDAARVRLQEVRFYPTDNPDSEERAFRAGELHATYSLPVSKLVAYRERSDPELHVSPQLCTGFLIFNVTRKPFDDVRVRRAFSLAVDRDRVIPEVFLGSASPAHALTRPGTARYHPPVAVGFDPDQARALLAQAGYPGGRGFPSVEFRFPTGPMRPLAEALQEIWRQELGINVEVRGEEQKSLFDDMHSLRYGFGVAQYFYGVNAPEMMLNFILSDSASNWTGWKSPAYDQDFRDASFAKDEAGRRAAYDAMERLIAHDSPVSALYYLNQPFLLSPQVKGWRDNSIDAIDWRELWLDPNAR